MRYISYKELESDENLPSIVTCIQEESYSHQETILSFLQSGKIELACGSRCRDVFNQELIPYEDLVRSDGQYFWPSILIWYVEKYNLRLPEDFEQHILRKAGIK